jgi:large subunit ribosomal protein L24e
MVRIYDCSFCGKEIEPGTGTMMVTRDNVLRFDNRKCKRSFEMKRDARKLKWTKKYQKKIITVEATPAKVTKSPTADKPVKAEKTAKKTTKAKK